MDPISAISVAAATLQFIDFSVKALVLCRQIRDDTHGSTESNIQLDARIRDVRESLQELRNTKSSSTQIGRRIDKLVNDSLNTSDEVIKLLEHVRSTANKSWTSAAKATFKAMSSKRDIEKLQNRLKANRDLLDSVLMQDTRLRVSDLCSSQTDGFNLLSDQCQAIVTRLQNLEAGAASQHAETSSRLSEVLLQTKDLSKDVRASSKKSSRQSKLLQKKIQRRRAASEAEAARQRLLDSLHYEELSSRQNSVRAPFENTCDWIFKRRKSRPWSDFSKWLESDLSIYWISGKAGSGKSTLMTYIVNDTRTRQHLEAWVRDEQLCLLTHFFWRAGSPLQRSIEGLLRALLCQLLSIVPAAADHVLNDTGISVSRLPSWTQKQLLRVLKAALGFTASTQCICLLIDGLDEYDGEYHELLDLIIDVAAPGNVKICLSSRPEASLLKRLEGFPKLRMEDANYDDIHYFASERLKDHALCEEFADTIVIDAEGVFLWASLTVRSMLEGIDNGDSDEVLSLRLSQTPKDIHGLVSSILRTIHPVYNDSLGWVFQLMGLQRMEAIKFLTVPMVTASKLSDDIFSYQTFITECRECAVRLAFQSKGLLEIVDMKDDRNNSKFWHEHMWALPQHDDDKCLYREFSRHGIIAKRVLLPVDDCMKEVTRFELKQINWFHRTVYDVIFGAEFGDIARRFLPAAPTKAHQALVDGMMKVLVAGPSAHAWPLELLECDSESFVQSSGGRVARIVSALAPLSGVGYPILSETYTHNILDDLRTMIPLFGSPEFPPIQDHHVPFSRSTGLEFLPPIARSLDAFWERCAQGAHHRYLLTRIPLFATPETKGLTAARILRCLCGDPAKISNESFITIRAATGLREYAELHSTLVLELLRALQSQWSEEKDVTLKGTMSLFAESPGPDEPSYVSILKQPETSLLRVVEKDVVKILMYCYNIWLYHGYPWDRLIRISSNDVPLFCSSNDAIWQICRRLLHEWNAHDSWPLKLANESMIKLLVPFHLIISPPSPYPAERLTFPPWRDHPTFDSNVVFRIACYENQRDENGRWMVNAASFSVNPSLNELMRHHLCSDSISTIYERMRSLCGCDDFRAGFISEVNMNTELDPSHKGWIIDMFGRNMEWSGYG